MYSISYSEKAVKQLKLIARVKPNDAKRILGKIEYYANNPLLTHDVKQLKGDYGDFQRLRVGSYRVIFDLNGAVMLIYEVKQRKDAYHD